MPIFAVRFVYLVFAESSAMFAVLPIDAIMVTAKDKKSLRLYVYKLKSKSFRTVLLAMLPFCQS